MIPEARLQEIERAIAVDDWFGAEDAELLVAEVRRLTTAVNLALMHLEDPRAIAAVRAALTEESEDIHDSMWRASQEGRR